MLEYAKKLDEARLHKTTMDKITLSYPQLTLDEGYLIQKEGIRLRCARGERVIGFKMGLTSDAKRKQMHVDCPIYGFLTDKMMIQNGEALPLKNRIHPKIEPEIAFFTGKELKGDISFEEALSACTAVCAALDVIDSRYTHFQFTLPDVVADDCSAAFFVAGPAKDPSTIDLSNLDVTLSINGETIASGTTQAISGHPIHSVIQLVKMLHAHHLTLPANSWVLAGSATEAVPLGPDMQITLSITGLDPLHVHSI